MTRTTTLTLVAVALALACPAQEARDPAPPRTHEAAPAVRETPRAPAEAPSARAARQAPDAAPAGRPAGAPAAPRLGPPTKTAAELVPGTGKLYAILRTNHGPLVARLFEKKAPVTVASFVGLATGQVPWRDPRTGRITESRFYDGLTFHRVIPRFMIQGGDPKGTGTGGPGYRFADEKTGLSFDGPGYLAMANSGPDTNGSQFFITEVATPHLNGRHTIFGKLVRGLKTVKAIARVRTVPGNRPAEPVTILRVDVIRAEEAPKP